MSGSLTWAMVYPIDVVKTLLQASMNGDTRSVAFDNY